MDISHMTWISNSFVEGIQFARMLVETEPLKNVIVTEAWPGKEVASKEQLRDFVRSHVESTYHPCGSCSMLPQEMGGVVDSNLRVYGTEGLRVVRSYLILFSQSLSSYLVRGRSTRQSYQFFPQIIHKLLYMRLLRKYNTVSIVSLLF